jgi:hypothetical protein
MQKSDLFRQRVVVEKAVLEDYQKTAGAVEGDTRTLVGMIAVQSFQRVWKLFYEFVLKADVGMVDVAWSRKREKTDRIFSLAKDKEREIKVLQDEFKEVLQEIE